jgi:hypothetical protein
MYHMSTKLLIVKIYCVGYLSGEKQNFVSLFSISDANGAKENMNFLLRCIVTFRFHYHSCTFCFVFLLMHVDTYRVCVLVIDGTVEKKKRVKKILRVSSDNMGFFFLALCVCVYCVCQKKNNNKLLACVHARLYEYIFAINMTISMCKFTRFN